jgi:outer membrane murein-binding lipoprotein Lpp
MRRILSILAIASMLLLAGCASQKRSDTLTATLNAYANVLRWDDFQSAAMFLDPKIRADHPLTALDMARYKQVKVSQYDEGNGPLPAGENQVEQTVHIGLVNINTQFERSIVDHQTWRYDEPSKHWWLTSGLPDITQQ